jgi:hypothetical protein
MRVGRIAKSTAAFLDMFKSLLPNCGMSNAGKEPSESFDGLDIKTSANDFRVLCQGHVASAVCLQ